MRRAVVAALLLAGFIQPGLADPCADKFVAVLTHSQKMKPAQAHIVTRMKGQPDGENEFLSVSADHFMVKPTKPKGPWYLTYDGVRYQSSDEGKTWQKQQSFDKAQAKADGIKLLTSQAATVRNAVCSEEMLDGVKHETLAADTTNLAPMKFEIHTKYWVDRAHDNFVTRSDTTMKTDSYEILTIQTWKPADGLTLPTPK